MRISRPCITSFYLDSFHGNFGLRPYGFVLVAFNMSYSWNRRLVKEHIYESMTNYFMGHVIGNHKGKLAKLDCFPPDFRHDSLAFLSISSILRSMNDSIWSIRSSSLCVGLPYPLLWNVPLTSTKSIGSSSLTVRSVSP